MQDMSTSMFDILDCREVSMDCASVPFNAGTARYIPSREDIEE